MGGISVLAWLLKEWKGAGMIALGLALCVFYGWHSYKVENLEKAAQIACKRAETAEGDLAEERKANDALREALALQEKATADALASRKVVYRTVQKEVARDEKARDWYNSPVPDSLVRIVRQGGGANGIDKGAGSLNGAGEGTGRYHDDNQR